MTKRDPEKTARNKQIAQITEKLQEMLPRVLRISGIRDIYSLNGRYGSKHAEFINIENEVIHSPEHFVHLWLQGYMRYLENLGPQAKSSAYYQNFLLLKEYKILRNYVILFLKRTYLRNIEALSKARPTAEESTIWIGQERASYGLLVAPRFRDGNWENDISEIRHFKKNYWTIGHILETGLVIPFANERIEFSNVKQYLSFFKNTLVRASGSPHEMKLAKRYCDFVLEAEDPEKIPLLIPEFRYGGIEREHEYRLDFCVIHPFEMSKVGFELSPWSTHGRLTGLKGKSQIEINRLAQANFEKEAKKLKSFFRKHGITIMVYTDTDLANPDAIFDDVSKYLVPETSTTRLQFKTMKDFVDFDL